MLSVIIITLLRLFVNTFSLLFLVLFEYFSGTLLKNIPNCWAGCGHTSFPIYQGGLGSVQLRPHALNQKIRQVSTCRIFLSKPQAWHIITERSVVHIISPCGAVSHHALACIYLRLDDIQPYGLMIYRNKLRIPCTAPP